MARQGQHRDPALQGADLGGSSGIVSLGVDIMPSKSLPLTASASFSGYVWEQKDAAGQLKLNYAFQASRLPSEALKPASEAVAVAQGLKAWPRGLPCEPDQAAFRQPLQKSLKMTGRCGVSLLQASRETGSWQGRGCSATHAGIPACLSFLPVRIAVTALNPVIPWKFLGTTP